MTDFITQIDFNILNAIQSIRTPFLDTIMPLITFLGSGGIVWAVTALIMLCFKKSRKTGIIIIVSLLLGLFLSTMGLKNVIARERPYNTEEALLTVENLLISAPSGRFSFPSGHAISSFSAATVILLYSKKLGIPAIILAALICFTRLYLYVHFPSDVICGALFGILLAFLSNFLVNKIWEKINTVPSLLLHSCCAPCSSYVLEYLSEYFDITIFYYNPNISPEEEFYKRVSEQKRLINEMPLNRKVKFIEGKYDCEKFYSIAKGLENLKEGGERCFKCYRLRLEETAKTAQKDGFDYFTTTLSISPHKNAQVLNQIGLELEESYSVKYLCSDFKKKNGYKRSCELSEIYGLYRQNYCGCIYSKLEADERERAKNNNEQPLSVQ